MSRLWLLAGLAFALLLMGLALRNGGILALTIPLVGYLGAALLYGSGESCLRARRELSAGRIIQGQPVEVRLTVVNEGQTLEELLIEDVLPASFEVVAGQARAAAFLPPGKTLEIRYTLRAGRGRFSLNEVRATWSETLGLLRRTESLAAPASLWSLPRVAPLPSVAIRPLRTHVFAGPVSTRQGGMGVNFLEVRDYQSGDPIRRVNWKRTARQVNGPGPRRLFTNEFEQERVADVGLILDARQQTNDVLPRDMAAGPGLFEHGVLATAALAEAFLGDGHRVGLLIYGRGQEATFPGYGKVQRERILRALAQAQTGENYALASLRHLPTRFFPAQSQLVLVSPLGQDDLPVLSRLMAFGYRLLVVSPDPVAFAAQFHAPDRALELATRIARLERALVLRKLRRAGVSVVDWQVDRPLGLALRAGLRRAPRVAQAVGGTP